MRIYVTVALEDSAPEGTRLIFDQVQVFAELEPAEAWALAWSSEAGGEVGHPEPHVWIGHPPVRPNGDPIDPEASWRLAYVFERGI